ncbi:hypothetical protein AVEN_128900-1 [Araneus ventricosus]|uniref:Uncharacterized protein n=1 Tax=Araneus ventricosus TaxID=182803 RepID=A0A4Y2THC4_ARAVE|nr:hypothetical protein AVEN_128900-1 [Araneus ventricosus]
MSEGERSQDLLSSSSTAPSNTNRSSTHSLGYVGEDSSKSYTESWIKDSSKQRATNDRVCQEIFRKENIIDINHGLAQELAAHIRRLEATRNPPAIIDSKRNEMQIYKARVKAAELALLAIGPCPKESCEKHHGPAMDATMEVETGQYSDSNQILKWFPLKRPQKFK